MVFKKLDFFSALAKGMSLRYGDVGFEIGL